MANAKRVSFTILRNEDHGLYKLMRRLIKKYHRRLLETNAVIKLAWAHAWKNDGDVDGVRQVGQVKKSGDLGRSLTEACGQRVDFVIVLHEFLWNNKAWTDDHRERWMNDFLFRCEVSRDSEGQPREDDQGNTVFRVRKSDIEMISDNVLIYGPYVEQSARLIESIMDRKERPLLGWNFTEAEIEGEEEEVEEPAAAGPGKPK